MPSRLSRLRTIGAFLLCLVLALLAVSTSQGESLGASWQGSTTLPTGISLHSCVSNGDYGYVYCIGGLTSTTAGQFEAQVEYGNFSSTGGVTTWRSATAYPFGLAGESCFTYVLSVYCVGGYYGFITTNAVYSAPVTLNGLGSWTQLTPYPTKVQLQSCVTSVGYVYCIGGYDGIRSFGSVYYAPLNKSGGIGTWFQAVNYPINASSISCAADSGYAYCVGGAIGSTGYNNVYYTPLLGAGGTGRWTNSTSYPTTVYSGSCTVNSGYLYCIGGAANAGYASAVYYAPISSSGVGAWTKTTSFPLPIIDESCLPYSGALYCFGGLTTLGVTNEVSYDTVTPPTPGTVTSTTTVTANSTGISTVTSTVTSSRTLTSTSVSTTTSTATSTSTSTIFSFLTTVKTTSLTSTITNTTTVKSVTTSTVTHTSTVTNITSTATVQHGFTVPSAMTEAIPGAIGLAAGVLLALLVTRLLRRGGSSKAPGNSPPAQIVSSGLAGR